MAQALAGALIAHFDSVFAGPNGDYPAVLESLAGLTVQQALWQPAAGSNSIWQIVDHLAASKAWLIDMLKTGHAAPPEWIQPAGDEAAWQALLSHLNEVHQQLKSELANLSDGELLDHSDPVLPQTLLELILSSGSAHEAHHSGQISYLRGLQGV